MLCLQKQKQATNCYIHIARKKHNKIWSNFLVQPNLCKLEMWYQIQFAKVVSVTVQFVQCAFSSKQLFAHANWKIWLGLNVAMETE